MLKREKDNALWLLHNLRRLSDAAYKVSPIHSDMHANKIASMNYCT